MSATCWPWPGPGDVSVQERWEPGSGLAALQGSGVPRVAQGRGLQGGSSPAAAGPRTGTESQPRDDGGEGKMVHPLQGAEHTSSNPCGRREGLSAQQEHVPNLPHQELAAPAAQDRGALQVVEHTSERLCVLRRLQPVRLSTCLWSGTSSSLLPWESRHRVPSPVLSPCMEPSVAILIIVALFGSNYLCTVKSKPCPGSAVLPGARAWQQA